MSRYSGNSITAKVFSDHIPAEWEGQPGFAEPPFSEVDDEVESGVPVCQLAFVNEHAEVDVPARNGLLDLIEVERDRLEIGLAEP
jgi:hypothetical protein